MRQLAYDPALVQRVWGRWKDTWRAMLRGQAWQGFTGREGVRLPGDGAVPRVGVGARDGEPAVFSREEQAEAQRRWKKEFGGTKVEGSGPPARVDVASDGHGVSVLPMTLFLLFERWQQHTGGPAGFPEAVRDALRRERERAALVVDRRRVGNDAWAWPGGFVDWMVRHAPPGTGVDMAVLFSGLTNHAGEPRPGCTAEPADAEWGMATDAWREGDGARRRWGSGATSARWVQGNPPFDERSVTKFCGFAQAAAVPVVGVLPVLPRAAGERVQGVLRRSAAEVWATVPPGGLRFVPEGFWTGREGRGGGDGCGTRSAVQLVSWGASLTEEAAAELRELLLATGRRGEWPVVSGQAAQGLRWGEEWLVPAVPLGAATAAPTAAARMATERQEEEAEWQAEAADKRRGAGKRAPAGGWAGKLVPRLSALMAGPWAGTRWWRGEGVGAPTDRLATTEQRTWRQMVQWGEVPDEVHNMLAFAGVSDRGRRLLVGRVSQAQRDASAQKVWHSCRTRTSG